MAISRLLLSQGHTLYLLNRGNRNTGLSGNLSELKADINDEAAVSDLIRDLDFDVVADFIAFVPEQLKRDYRLFGGKTRQFIYISSASAYQKPLSDYRVSEGTPLANPYWEYSRNKIAGEDYLMRLYREEGFPVTIIRPSHTYDERSVPLGVHGKNGSYSVIQRMQEGRPVIIHGDGTSLWTLTHNSDFARAFVGLMGNVHAIGEAVQITSDESLTWNQIYGIIADSLGVKLNAVHVSSEFLDACGDYDFAGSLLGDKANTVVFDNNKLKRLVPGFTVTVRADQGIRDTIAYVLSHPECQRQDPEFDSWCDRVINALDAAKRAVRQEHA
jgi:nucleoside-diphosphate-sugar epimerase